MRRSFFVILGYGASSAACLSLVEVYRPVCKPVERGGGGGRQAVDEAARCQDGRGSERNGRDGRALVEIAVQRACGLLTLALEEGVEQRIALFVGVAAVVERAAGAHERGDVPIRRQTDFAEIEIKVAVLQRGQIVVPWQRAHLDRQRAA